MTTKKILFTLVLAALALSAGYAYADEKEATLINGITVFEAVAYFDAGPIALERSEVSGPDMMVANGATLDGHDLWFDIGAVEHGSVAGSSEYGSAAGGMSPDDPGLIIGNGITDFTGGRQAD